MSDPKENKCNLCGLRVVFSQKGLQQAQSVEEFFTTLRKLQKDGRVPKGWPRVINASLGVADPDDSSEICAINHPSWRKNKKKCKYWQPAIGLPLSEYLTQHAARKMEILTKDIHKLTAVAAIIPVAYLIIELYKWAS
jgi:hypothetical protein